MKLRVVALVFSATLVVGIAFANPHRDPPIRVYWPACPNVGAMQPGDHYDANGVPVFVNRCVGAI